MKNVCIGQTLLAALIDMARQHVQDIATGIEGGIYDAAENKDVADKQQAVEAAEMFYHQATLFGDTTPAELFFQELLASAETLTGIADEHGARTLADLMYLQNAIANGGFIDHYPDESKVLDIARALPSGDEWLTFIKVEYLAAPADESDLSITLDGLLTTEHHGQLDTMLRWAADECDYHAQLAVSWSFWHYGRHAEFAEERGMPALSQLFDAAWQIEHRVHGQEEALAAAAREEIKAEYAPS